MRLLSRAGRSTPLKYFGLLAVLLFLVLAVQGIATAAVPWLTVSGNQLRDPNGNRVILRGISLIDIGAQQTWYGGVNSVVDRITNKSDSAGSSPGWYPKVIRLPCAPQGTGGPWSWTPNDGDNFYNNLLRPLVNYCRTKDIYVIIDLHYVDNVGVNPTYVNQFWTYMAPRFANDSHVMFELFNEPIETGTDAQKWTTVRGRMQTWYNTVRTYATRNIILIGTPQYAQILTPVVSNPVSGTNIMYVVHTYPLHWGNGNSWNVQQITSTANTLPLFMTEWGFTQTSDTLLNGSISGFGQPIVNLLDQYGISWIAWVASTDWGPPMFNSNWTLRVGPNEMGGFVKDTLYAKRNNNLPSDASTGQTIANGTYKVICRNGGKALDAYGNGTANGTVVHQWTYGGGNNQRWIVTHLGNNQYSIVNVNANKALDVTGSGTANGTSVALWTYGGGNNQKWTIVATSGGYYRVSPVHASGTALDVNGSSTADGAKVQIWAYGGGNNQQWAFQAP